MRECPFYFDKMSTLAGAGLNQTLDELDFLRILHKFRLGNLLDRDSINRREVVNGSAPEFEEGTARFPTD